MIREEYGDNVYYFFDSMGDFTKYLLKIEDYFPYHSKQYCSSFSKYDEKFHETKNWQEFMEKLYFGSKNYSSDDNIFFTKNYTSKFQRKKDICGVPSIPLFLMNQPKSYHKRKKTNKVSFYPIYINACETWYVDSGDIKEYKSFVFDKINYLISKANTVQLNWYEKTLLDDNKTMTIMIKLKDPQYHVNINRLMFFITSPDISRRGCFRIGETESFAYKNCRKGNGYGKAESETDSIIEGKLNGISVKNLSSFSSLDEAKRNIESKLTSVNRN